MTAFVHKQVTVVAVSSSHLRRPLSCVSWLLLFSLSLLVTAPIQNGPRQPGCGLELCSGMALAGRQSNGIAQPELLASSTIRYTIFRRACPAHAPAHAPAHGSAYTIIYADALASSQSINQLTNPAAQSISRSGRALADVTVMLLPNTGKMTFSPPGAAGHGTRKWVRLVGVDSAATALQACSSTLVPANTHHAGAAMERCQVLVLVAVSSWQLPVSHSGSPPHWFAVASTLVYQINQIKSNQIKPIK